MMNLRLVILSSLLGLCFSMSYAQLTIRVTSIPSNTPAGDDIYIAGSFNNWQPNLSDYILSENNGQYEIVLDIAPSTIEFKFTRGSWDTVEGNASGGFLPNHIVEYSGGMQTEELPILTWEGQGGTGVSTAADNVSVLDLDFQIPQLNRSRRIWLYLPPDYYSSTTKRYPVLYMHDGQNLFDNSTSFAGEWGVDESLNELAAQGDYGIIVIGIDNGGIHRLDEYSPWTSVIQGQTYGGEGDEYVDFIVNTLKPFIDSNYRTLTTAPYTGIMGSSMGGLISHYAAMEYPEVFGRAGLFSPSYWFSDEVYDHTLDAGANSVSKFYSIAGQLEGPSMINGVNQMESTFEQTGFEEGQKKLLIHPDGTHSESYWNREFSEAYQWLFGESTVSTSDVSKDPSFYLSPIPTQGNLLIEWPAWEDASSIEVYDLVGRRLMTRRMSEARSELDVSRLLDGIYLLRIYSAKGEWTKRFVVQH